MFDLKDLRFFVQKCLTDNSVDTKSLENLFREKAVDHAALYAEANTFGVELFKDLDLEERKQKLEDQVREHLVWKGVEANEKGSYLDQPISTGHCPTG